VPWWAVALPAVAFAVLLALLSGGTAHASSGAADGDLLARFTTAFTALLHHLW
jgi:predicted membrane protein